MALYYFTLKTGRQLIPDCEGQEFENESHARLHAITVARELMRHRELDTHGWRIEVCDDYLLPLFDLLFAEADEPLARPPPALKASITQAARRISRSNGHEAKHAGGCPGDQAARRCHSGGVFRRFALIGHFARRGGVVAGA